MSENAVQVRKSWLDVCRVLAIVLVVLNHSVEEIFIANLYGNQSTSLINTVFMYVCFTLGRIGVPLFLIISGTLLLSEAYTKERMKKFYSNNFKHLVCATLIWIVIYNLFDCIFYQKSFSPIYFVMELLMLKQNSMPHMWYMPMIIGIYLAVPFVANAINDFSERMIITIGGIVIAYTLLLPTFVQIINILGINKQCSYSLNLDFLGGYYGIYLIVGYLFTKKYFKNKSRFSFLGVIAFIIMVALQVFANTKGITYRVWYDCVFLVVCAIGICCLLNTLEVKKNSVKESRG